MNEEQIAQHIGTTLNKWFDFREQRGKEIVRTKALIKTHINSIKTLQRKLKILEGLQ